MPSPTRRLVLVPIVHTQADLGSMGEQFREQYIRRVGQEQWADHVRAVEQLWVSIGAALDGLRLNWRRVRLYQDGLPVCGREEEIVREVARGGSKNHQLLMGLMSKGAKLTGTESPELLLEEYNLIRCSLETPPTEGQPDPRAALRQELLVRRDRFIAGRIAETLEEGRTGLLFLGMLHSIAPHLPGDIVVTPLQADGQPKRGRTRPE